MNASGSGFAKRAVRIDKSGSGAKHNAARAEYNRSAASVYVLDPSNPPARVCQHETRDGSTSSTTEVRQDLISRPSTMHSATNRATPKSNEAGAQPASTYAKLPMYFQRLAVAHGFPPGDYLLP
jgi:hypothetical protein